MTSTPSTAAATEPVAVASPRTIRLMFSGLLVAMLLASLDQTIFSTALPTVVGELHGVAHMAWVTTAYLVAATIVMPIYGKLGDLIGRKPLFIVALGLFVAGSTIGVFTQDMTTLIAARAVQGLGGGGLMLLSQALIADVVPARDRGRYMGVMGAVFGFSAILGPLLGGWFTEGPGWRWAFGINIPLGLLAIAAAITFIPHLHHPTDRPRIDVAGIVTMAISVTSIILISSWGGSQYDWDSPQILGLAALALISGLLFLLAEHRAEQPIIPLHLFGHRDFNLATLSGLIVAISMFGAIAYLPTYVQMVKGYSATSSGYLMLWMIAGLMVTAIVSGNLISRTGRYRWYPPSSAVVICLGLLLLSRLQVDTPTWQLGISMFVLGAGIGLSMQVFVLIVQNTFPHSEVGTATAANNFFREIGATLGSAIVGTLFASRLTTLLTERLGAGESAGLEGSATLTPGVVRSLPAPLHDVIVSAYNDALTPVFAWLAPIVLINIVLSFGFTGRPLATTIDDEDETGASEVPPGPHAAERTQPPTEHQPQQPAP